MRRIGALLVLALSAEADYPELVERARALLDAMEE
jgi:hypothetical protein